mmetsp:Transcript_7255/g.45385  ORF Transcript_7255/g.45385 Transcript_7255/m.45385 type:complete len:210 (-) Transcript_7255:258-887(-)
MSLHTSCGMLQNPNLVIPTTSPVDATPTAKAESAHTSSSAVGSTSRLLSTWHTVTVVGMRNESSFHVSSESISISGMSSSSSIPLTSTLGISVSASAAFMASDSTSSKLPPTESTTASMYMIQHVFPWTIESVVRSSAQYFCCVEPCRRLRSAAESSAAMSSPPRPLKVGDAVDDTSTSTTIFPFPGAFASGCPNSSFARPPEQPLSGQ